MSGGSSHGLAPLRSPSSDAWVPNRSPTRTRPASQVCLPSSTPQCGLPQHIPRGRSITPRNRNSYSCQAKPYRLHNLQPTYSTLVQQTQPQSPQSKSQKRPCDAAHQQREPKLSEAVSHSPHHQHAKTSLAIRKGNPLKV